MPRVLPNFFLHFSSSRLVEALLIVAVLLWPAAAMADVDWTLSKKAGHAYLQGFSSEIEGDSEFSAHCRPDGSIQVGAGAHSEVGKGRGEVVTLTLVSGGATAKLTGTSRKSENFEMTSGTELRTKISRGDPLFAVFASGKSIAVTGSLAKGVTWKVKGLKAKAAAFLQACGSSPR